MNWTAAAVASFLTAVIIRPSGALALPAEGSAMQRQLESVERQRAAAGLSHSTFFANPWPWRLVTPPSDEAAVVSEAGCERIPPARLDAYIEQIAARDGFTPDLLRAVIQKESAYAPCAVSSHGAQGLMQLMPATAAILGVSDPFDPKENISAGARYLKELLGRYDGDLSRALAAYNAGPGRVDQYDGLPPIPETMDYVSDILSSLESSPKQP